MNVMMMMAVVMMMMMMMMMAVMITFMQHPDTRDHITGTCSSMACMEQKWCICQQLVLKHKVLPQGHNKSQSQVFNTNPFRK
jgi:hypothetical protein